MRCAVAHSALLLLASIPLGCADEPLHGEYARYVPALRDPGPTMWDGESASASVERPHRGTLGPPYPVILVHGFSGWSDLGAVGYFFQVEEDLSSLGVDVTAPALPPYAVPDERARVLAAVIDSVLERTGKGKVHLIGHSQGGIDIRRTVSPFGLRYGPVVASVTTISTPYRGTALADLASQAPDGLLNPAGRLFAWLIGLGEGEPPSEAAWANEETSDAWSPELAAVMRALTTEEMTALMEQSPWPPEVPLFTIAGVSNLRSLDNDDCAGGLWERSDRVDATDPFLVGSGTYLSFTDGGDFDAPTPNDGLVTVRSARAPESTFLGCLPADHFDEMGQIADLGPGILSGFDHKEMYRRIVENARAVE